VKMVHNGIEYGDMQMICELPDDEAGLGMSNEEMHAVWPIGTTANSTPT